MPVTVIAESFPGKTAAIVCAKNNIVHAVANATELSTTETDPSAIAAVAGNYSATVTLAVGTYQVYVIDTVRAKKMSSAEITVVDVNGTYRAVEHGTSNSASSVWSPEDVEYVLEQLALLTVSGGGIVVPMGDFMCARVDVERVYGSDNVAAWADINNNKDVDEIEAQINYAISVADSEMRGSLASSQWIMPSAGDTLPVILVHNVAKLAGVKLYESRYAVNDLSESGGQHQLAVHKRDVGRFIQSVLLGAISISPLTSTVNSAAPNVI